MKIDLASSATEMDYLRNLMTKHRGLIQSDLTCGLIDDLSSWSIFIPHCPFSAVTQHEIFIIYLLFYSLNLALLPCRWWWWGREWWRAPSFLLWLHHALPYGLLESSVCLCATHWVLERLGMFHRINHINWRLNGSDGWSGLPLWMHHRPKRLCYRCGVCSTGHLSTRSINKQMNYYTNSNVEFIAV